MSVDVNRTQYSIVKSSPPSCVSLVFHSTNTLFEYPPHFKDDPPNFDCDVSMAAVPLNVNSCANGDRSVAACAPFAPSKRRRRTLLSTYGSGPSALESSAPAADVEPSCDTSDTGAPIFHEASNSRVSTLITVSVVCTASNSCRISYHFCPETTSADAPPMKLFLNLMRWMSFRNLTL